LYDLLLTLYKYVFMVGGFSESPYMFEKIKTFVTRCDGLQAVKPAYP